MRVSPVLISLLSIFFVPTILEAQHKTIKEPQRIARQALLDKIRGGWAGQMIGVSYGAPTEFKSKGKIIEGDLNGFMKWIPQRLENSINQDDLYVEMTFAEVMDRLGLDATTEDYGEMFKNSKYELWHANAAARRLLNNGIKAPMSGNPKYNIHANDIDFQIESDFIGLMTPGLPQEANKYCDRVGHVMNYGDGVYGGMFVTGMYSAAFFKKDVREIVELGVASLPAESGYAKVIRDVLSWSVQYPEDWKKTWQLIEDKWDKNDSCPHGAMDPFNIDARLNGAHIALGLLYGKGDVARTLDIATRSGQDSDCNPSSAAGILGVLLGYSGIPDEWKSGIARISDTKFNYTKYSFNEIVKSTETRALKVIKRSGGKVTESEVIVPYQEPKPAKLEQWEMGVPQKQITFKDAAWSWKGNWSEEALGPEWEPYNGMVTTAPGAEAMLSFTGTSIAVVGQHLHYDQGGRADIYLDGEKVSETNTYIVEQTNDTTLWHAFGLKPGFHTLKAVSRADTHPQSKGKRIAIAWAIAYSD